MDDFPELEREVPTWATRITALALALVLLAGVGLGSYRLGADQAPQEALDPGAATAAPGGLETVGEMYDRIREEAVRVPEDDALLEGALEGMLETLDDPYAVYYDQTAFAEFSEALEGNFYGVGLVLEETPEGFTIIRVLPGTPAQEAGIEEDERIVSVDGRDVTDMPLTAVVDLVKGEEGTTVLLGLEGGAEGPREVPVERAQIDLPILESEVREDGVAHLQLLSFTRGAAAQVRQSLEALLEGGIRAVVLDLRGNPGGLLREAVDVMSVFADEGVVVEVQERDGELQTLEVTGDAIVDLPLVVLVDDRTASSSEIVAGAVQDLGRGTVVGVTTFGKGTVQTIRSLSDGGGFKLTTAEYYTPSGDSIEGVGVVPDREVDDPEEQLAVAEEILREEVAAGAAPRG